MAMPDTSVNRRQGTSTPDGVFTNETDRGNFDAAGRPRVRAVRAGRTFV